MLEKTYSLTIAIPAHNEEQNIQLLLEAILKQTSAFYILEKIIILCDGCTDNTEIAVSNFAKDHPIISVINDGQRRGKSERLNQIYKINTSEIVMTMDADLVLGNAYVLDELIRHFDDEQTVVVSANGHPMPGENFLEKMINTWYEFWYEVRCDYKNGDTIHNIHGAIMAIRKSFAENLVYPKGTIANSQYLYFAVKSMKKQYYFAKEAMYYFYSPNTFKDYLLLLNRYNSERQKNAATFGSWIYGEYFVPKRHKIRALVKMMKVHPLLITTAFLFHLWRKKMLSSKSSVQSEGLWHTVKSTKRTIKKKYTLSVSPNL